MLNFILFVICILLNGKWIITNALDITQAKKREYSNKCYTIGAIAIFVYPIIDDWIAWKNHIMSPVTYYSVIISYWIIGLLLLFYLFNQLYLTENKPIRYVQSVIKKEVIITILATIISYLI